MKIKKKKKKKKKSASDINGLFFWSKESVLSKRCQFNLRLRQETDMGIFHYLKRRFAPKRII